MMRDGTGAGTRTYQWDAEGRLKSVDSGSTASYTYNPLGQRGERVISGTTYREYVYDGFGRLIGEHKRDARYYRFFPLGWTPLAKHAGGATLYVHGNHLGSTRFVSHRAGDVAPPFRATRLGGCRAEARRYAWGQRWASGGTIWEAPALREESCATIASPCTTLAPAPVAEISHAPDSRSAYRRNPPENACRRFAVTHHCA